MATSFKGIYNAFDFAYGVNGAAPGALQVLEGSNVAGTYTIKCAPAVLQSADGNAIILAANTPITIGGDSGIETVTPSSVSTDQLGRLLITATFANAHGVGAQVRSGSRGIAEAVNYAKSIGGGLVAVTTQSGLTSATVAAAINAVSGYASVVVLDYTGTTGAKNHTSTGTSSAVAYITGSVTLY